ncbi:MAG: hypothetical protein GY866_02290 [Proteobacteria bacterium]|nr:hypothetical protein [Pseudomonadota bacterium]
MFVSFGGIDWDYLNYGFRNNKNSIKWKEQDSDLDARHNIQLISLGAKICVWKFVALDFFGSELCGVGSIGQLAYDYTDNQGGKEHDVVSIVFPTVRASVSLSLWRFTVKYGVDTYYLPSNILQGKLLGYDTPVQCRPTRCPKKMVISKEYGAISVRLGSF